ncbi:MAG: DJ-1/PfpI family protein [Candidatus Saccharibacteria bacterium]
MRFALFIYPNFALFEVVLTSYFLTATGNEGMVVSTDGTPVRSMDGVPVSADSRLSDLDLDGIDLFIVPGGLEKDIPDKKTLHDTLRRLNGKGAVIAAICGGPLQLGRAGLLTGRRFTSSIASEHPDAFAGATYVDENVVIDGNIVTAQPYGYVDLALELGKMFKVFKDERDYIETVQGFREQRRPTC